MGWLYLASKWLLYYYLFLALLFDLTVELCLSKPLDYNKPTLEATNSVCIRCSLLITFTGCAGLGLSARNISELIKLLGISAVCMIRYEFRKCYP